MFGFTGAGTYGLRGMTRLTPFCHWALERGSSALLVIRRDPCLARIIQGGGFSRTVFSDETEVAMDVSALLPDSTALRLEEVTVSQGVARLVVSSTRRNGVCPSCGQSGARIHSHYQRKLQDLPWQGITVSVLWRSRKFFCDTPGCPRQVFTERLPLVAEPYARRTSRLSKIVAHLGIALGGEAGGSRHNSASRRVPTRSSDQFAEWHPPQSHRHA